MVYVAKWLFVQEEHLREIYEEEEATQKFATLVTSVLSHIRFPMMTPRQRASLSNHSLACRFRDFFLGAMMFAMNINERHTAPNLDLFVPRLYTCPTWCTQFVVENYPILTAYSYRTLTFSTPSSIAEWDNCHQTKINWTMDIYPKGVWFRKFYLLLWRGRSEMPEYVIKSVRVSVSPDISDETIRATVGVLVCGKEDSTEHIQRVISKEFLFTNEDRVLNLEDVIPYEELNCFRSSYLVGEKSDTLRIMVVVLPTLSTCHDTGQKSNIPSKYICDTVV
ncbi:uncharacterized protein LOC111620059 [Centruroides sculpturatus]|uniref:uncharacterized protein LOC111620059 n=1 Tax=Centruroides sculpturatus TaxID=218467 RepID=UPI000C6E127B|nr:uncharacterized protein LOC111620059 [Centruroides sculpturatus]